MPRGSWILDLQLRRGMRAGNRGSSQLIWKNVASAYIFELSSGSLLRDPFREDPCLELKLMSAERVFSPGGPVLRGKQFIIILKMS